MRRPPVSTISLYHRADIGVGTLMNYNAEAGSRESDTSTTTEQQATTVSQILPLIGPQITMSETHPGLAGQPECGRSASKLVFKRHNETSAPNTTA